MLSLFFIYIFFFSVLNIPCFANVLLDTLKRSTISHLGQQLKRSLSQTASMDTIQYSPKSHLGQQFKRVVSQEKGIFKLLSASNKHLLLATRWTNNIDKGWISDKPKLIKEGSCFDHSPIMNFHEELAERISDKKNQGIFKWEDFLTLKKPKRDSDSEDWDLLANKQEEKGSFVNGHFLALKGFTQFSKVMVTLSSKSNKSDAEQVAHEWFLPIEQALLCSTLKEYRESVAILKDWGPYSRFGLSVMRANTFVSLRMGIAAPQSLPAFHHSYRNKLSKKFATKYVDDRTIKITDMVHAAKLSDHLWRFYETLGGGATQFFIAYAYNDSQNRKIEDINIRERKAFYSSTKPTQVFEIPDALYKYDDKYSFNNVFDKQYKGKIKKDEDQNNNDWDLTDWRDLHFCDDSYDSLQIGLHVALKNAEIISEDEYKDIEEILKEIRTWLKNPMCQDRGSTGAVA